MPTIEDGRTAAEAGNLQQARLIYEAILQENPRSEEAWLNLGDVLTETNDKRICYENVLKINKNNRAAREALRNLQPEEDPFVAALKQKTATTPIEEEEEEEFLEDIEDTMVSMRSDSSAEKASGETPTAVLVAIGLGLAVVVFAIASGLIFFVLSSVTVP
ncbi:MAG: tetratricopeptide repeat protein [Anaerolineae bacterium]|nr:tetratricopeptide repeat protein [Anaerolineae bacterium]